MTKERVVVTGIGTISALGIGKDDFWAALLDGRSGIGRVTLVAPELQSSCKIAGEVRDFDPLKYLEPKQAKRMDRFIQFAIAGSKLAVADAKLDMAKEDANRVGVVV